MTRNFYETSILKIKSLDLFNILSKALSNKDRIETLNYLYDNPDVKHGELKRHIKTKPQRRSNFFSYHLMWLKKAQLVIYDKRRQLYSLSDLGYDCMDFIKRIEQRQAGARILTDEGIFSKIDNPKKYISFLKNTIRFYNMNFPEVES